MLWLKDEKKKKTFNLNMTLMSMDPVSSRETNRREQGNESLAT